jgi:hypothetical protein
MRVLLKTHRRACHACITGRHFDEPPCMYILLEYDALNLHVLLEDTEPGMHLLLEDTAICKLGERLLLEETA